MIESGSCGGGLISTASECEAAATALGLSDKTAADYTSDTSSYWPPGCHFVYSSLYVEGGGSSGSCSSSQQCICMFTPPPSPPSPPSPPTPPPLPPAPPMLPGHVQTAGGYYMIESGSCGGGLVSTVSECEAAATALELSDKTAWDGTSNTFTQHPPGCVWSQSRYLYLFNG
eukprot:scaffold11504_cov42-Phaeocystis_antarctica.AAC.1